MNCVFPPQAVDMVGRVIAIASCKGRPQPSPCVGNTNAFAALYRDSTWSVENGLPVNAT